MNEPIKSKINYTALATQVMTIIFIAGLIPMEYMTPFIAIIGIVMPAIVQFWRTYHTVPK